MHEDLAWIIRRSKIRTPHGAHSVASKVYEKEAPLPMPTPSKQDERIAQMTFASVYPHYVTKVEKKGRSEAELQEVISWLTGFTMAQVKKHITKKSTFEDIFAAATLHPNASSIQGVSCGYRVEEIENPLTQKVRYLDKLVDELARGRKMEKILRE